MRTSDGYYSCDRCGAPGLRSVVASGGGSDLCLYCAPKPCATCGGSGKTNVRVVHTSYYETADGHPCEVEVRDPPREVPCPECRKEETK